jgi:hypothetical protein
MGRRKLTDEVRDRLIQWLTNCSDVRISPYRTRRVRCKDGSWKKEPLILLEKGLTLLYNKAVREGVLGRPACIREATFWNAVPRNFRRLTECEIMCGCAECLEMGMLHRALAHWRTRLELELGAEVYKPPAHKTPEEAAAAVTFFVPRFRDACSRRLSVTRTIGAR